MSISSLSCHSRPVWLSAFIGTQKEIVYRMFMTETPQSLSYSECEWSLQLTFCLMSPFFVRWKNEMYTGLEWLEGEEMIEFSFKDLFLHDIWRYFNDFIEGFLFSNSERSCYTDSTLFFEKIFTLSKASAFTLSLNITYCIWIFVHYQCCLCALWCKFSYTMKLQKMPSLSCFQSSFFHWSVKGRQRHKRTCDVSKRWPCAVFLLSFLIGFKKNAFLWKKAVCVSLVY